MSAHVFFDIPKIQQVELLTHWLNLSDIVNLDSAICSHKWRPDFLNLLSCEELVLPELYDFTEEYSEDWVIHRKVCFAEVDLCSRILSNDATRKGLLKTLGPKLKSITVWCEQDSGTGWVGEVEPPLPVDQIFIDISDNCTNLRRILIGSANADETLPSLINANHLLEEITLTGCVNITPLVLKLIISLPCLTAVNLLNSTITNPTTGTAPTCEPNYKCLKLIVHNCTVRVSLVFWLCQSMPNLTCMHADLHVGYDLERIAGYCPHVVEACVTLKIDLNNTEARTIAKHWQGIRSLVILRTESRKHLSVCHESVTMIFIDECKSLLQLKLAGTERTDLSISSKRYVSAYYDVENAALGKGDTTRSRLTDLCVPSLSAQSLAMIVKKCVYLNTLRIMHPAPVAVHANAAEFALHHLAGTRVQTLFLRNCTNLDGKHILPLKRMTKLFLCNSRLATLRASHITELCQGSPALRELYIQDCAGIGHEVVLGALDLCPLLTHFEYCAMAKESLVESNPALSIMTTVIHRNFPNLKYFSVQF